MNGQEIIRYLEASDALPVVERELAELMLMLHNSDEINVSELADKIVKCGNLRKALLKNVNSGYFKLVRKVESLSDAIVYLGMNTVEKLIVAHLVKAILPDTLGRSEKITKGKYWRHCLGTSIAANLLAEKLHKKDEYRYFAYGLIHDLGTIVLDICFPEIINEVFRIEDKGIHQVVGERMLMSGFTHSHIGAWLCDKWNLPDDIKEIVEYHHTPLLAKVYKEDVAIISVADSISTLYYERLLCMNTHYVINSKALEFLGLTMEDVEEISNILPEKVEQALNLFNFAI